MIEGAFGATGLNFNIYNPLVIGGGWIKNYTAQVTDYSHEKGADDYCISASATLVIPVNALQEWYLEGLGRHVELKSPGQLVVWEGFVNQVTIGIGQETYTVGPLMDLGNRVYVAYTPVYVSASAGTIVKGTETETPLVNDTSSQAKYGIIEKMLSAGECIVTSTQNEANYFRDVFLKENAFPKIPVEFSYGGQEIGSVALDCVGYWKWLDAFIYNNRIAGTGWSVISTKLQTVLGANPNAWSFTADYSEISTTTGIAMNMEKNNRSALTVIKGMTAAGDPSGNRWLFGIGIGKKPYYRIMPTQVEYQYLVYNNQQMLTWVGSNAPIPPWEIEPGKWYMSRDFYSPLTEATTIYQNPTARFIETVRYTAPLGFDLVEGSKDTIPQLLAMKGLSSI